jgi:hypothetical protein
MGLCMEHWTAGSYDVRACFMSCFGLKNLRHPYGLEDPETIAIDTACNLPYQTCLSFDNIHWGVLFEIGAVQIGNAPPNNSAECFFSNFVRAEL